MARYQNKPTLIDLATRRGQNLEQLLRDWGITTHEQLVVKCKREGLEMSDHVFTTIQVPVVVAPLERLIDEPVDIKNDVKKKRNKSRFTLDEPVDDNESLRLDQDASVNSKDSL